MFAKLLKYEWKASAGILSLLSGCALGLGCISAVILRVLTTNWDSIMENDASVLFLIPAFLFLFVAYLGIVVFAACVQYILLYRFYKSRFTDEGYLMFTLPVKTSHLFLSSALHMLIWSVIALVVIVVSLTIAVVLGPVWPDEVTEVMKMAFSEMPMGFQEVLGPGYVITGLVSLIVMGAYGIVAPMSAVVVGSSIAKKHKILTIIGILMGLSMVTGMVNSVISGIIQVFAITSENIQVISTLTPLLSCLLPLGITIGGYFLSVHIMKHRLNLP